MDNTQDILNPAGPGRQRSVSSNADLEDRGIFKKPKLANEHSDSRPILFPITASSSQIRIDNFFNEVLNICIPSPTLPVDPSNLELKQPKSVYLDDVVDKMLLELKGIQEKASPLVAQLDQLRKQPVAIPTSDSTQEEYIQSMRRDVSAAWERYSKFGYIMNLRQKIQLVRKLAALLHERNFQHIQKMTSIKECNACIEELLTSLRQRQETIQQLEDEISSARRQMHADTTSIDEARNYASDLEDRLLNGSSNDLIQAALNIDVTASNKLNPEDSALAAIASEYDATLTYDHEYGYIVMDFIHITINLKNGRLSLQSTLPDQHFEVMQYLFNYIEMNKSKLRPRRIMAIWTWGMSLNDTIISLTAAGQRKIEISNSSADNGGELIITQKLDKFDSTLIVKLHGTKLSVSGIDPGIGDTQVVKLLNIQSL